MGFITRNVMRWGLIGALALGGVTLLVGPERVATGLAQIRVKAQHVVDNALDDPMALRRQLEQLAEEYPDRIAEVRGELAEVDRQLAEFHRDVEVSKRVVAMTTDDLHSLQTLVARAESDVVPASYGQRPVLISFQGRRFTIDQAYNEGRRISTVRSSYQDRQENDEFQLQLLHEQKSRLGEILGRLEEEFSTYQTQLWQLDREIDAIQRNDRLIELYEQQQATLQSYEGFGKVDNLSQLQAKLAELRAEQEAQLQYLRDRGFHTNYEEMAEYELDTAEMQHADPFRLDGESENEPAPTDDSSVAFSGPVVIK